MKFPGLGRNGRHIPTAYRPPNDAERRYAARRTLTTKRTEAPTGCFQRSWTL